MKIIQVSALCSPGERGEGAGGPGGWGRLRVGDRPCPDTSLLSRASPQISQPQPSHPVGVMKTFWGHTSTKLRQLPVPGQPMLKAKPDFMHMLKSKPCALTSLLKYLVA